MNSLVFVFVTILLVVLALITGYLAGEYRATLRVVSDMDKPMQMCQNDLKDQKNQIDFWKAQAENACRGK